MQKALIFKEWVKTRMVFFISLALAVCVALYAVLMMKRLVELKGMDHLWLIMLLDPCAKQPIPSLPDIKL